MEHFNSAEFLISTFIGILSPNQLHSIIPIGAVSKPKVLYLANQYANRAVKDEQFYNTSFVFSRLKSLKARSIVSGQNWKAPKRKTKTYRSVLGNVFALCATFLPNSCTPFGHIICPIVATFWATFCPMIKKECSEENACNEAFVSRMRLD